MRRKIQPYASDGDSHQEAGALTPKRYLLIALAVVIAAAGVVTHIYTTGPPAITGQRVFGSGSNRLIVRPAQLGGTPRISEGKARDIVDRAPQTHPSAFGSFKGNPRLVLFGLGLVTTGYPLGWYRRIP